MFFAIAIAVKLWPISLITAIAIHIKSVNNEIRSTEVKMPRFNYYKKAIAPVILINGIILIIISGVLFSLPIEDSSFSTFFYMVVFTAGFIMVTSFSLKSDIQDNLLINYPLLVKIIPSSVSIVMFVVMATQINYYNNLPIEKLSYETRVNSDVSSSQDKQTDSVTSNIYEPEISSTAKESKETSLPDSDKQVIYELSDFDSVMDAYLLEGHPVFMGSIDNAIKYQKRFKRGLILVDEKYQGSPIMNIIPFVLDDFKGQISEIELYFSHFGVLPNDEEACLIAESYLGTQILNTYSFSEGRKTSSSDSDRIYYTLSFKKIKPYSNEKHYFGDIHVLFEDKGNGIEYAWFNTSLPNWLSRTTLNGFSVEPWDAWEKISTKEPIS